MTMPPEEPDHVAQMDQACASFRDAARMHAAYFKQLLTESVPEAAATELTVGYFTALMDNHEEPEGD